MKEEDDQDFKSFAILPNYSNLRFYALANTFVLYVMALLCILCIYRLNSSHNSEQKL